MAVAFPPSSAFDIGRTTVEHEREQVSPSKAS
jgi:hypothetical protein